VRTIAPTRPVFYGWVVLAASVGLSAVGTGTIFSLAVFLRPLEEEFGWTRSLISGIALVNWIIFGLGSFAWGALSDRIGARRVVGLGATVLGAALALSSQVRSAAQLYVAFGILGAIGASAFYVPLAATATRWFAVRRGLAMGIISGGMGLGIFLVPPTARGLITALGWRATFALFGGLAWVVGIVAVRHLVNRPGGPRAPELRRGPRIERSPSCSSGRGHEPGRGAPASGLLGRGARPLRVLRGAFGADLPHGRARDGPRRHQDGTSLARSWGRPQSPWP
jgi:MFS family permease